MCVREEIYWVHMHGEGIYCVHMVNGSEISGYGTKAWRLYMHGAYTERVARETGRLIVYEGMSELLVALERIGSRMPWGFMPSTCIV